MTIETKYNIGDEVWMMHCKKPTCVLITNYRIDKYDIMYLYEGAFIAEQWAFEDDLYPTKEELLKSLEQ